MINDWSLMKKLIWLRGSPISGGSEAWNTISGAIVEFITQRAHKLKSCVVTLEPIQDLSHGDPSPTNICPISGWDGCEVWDTGINLGIVKNLYVGGASGLAIGNDGVLICFSAVKGQTYRIYGASGNRNNLFKFRGNMADIKAGASMSALDSSSNLPYVITADETCIYCYYRNSTWSETIANALMVVVGDTEQPYEPYNGDSYSVTFGETVYGANPDIVSGEMPVTMGMVDMGSLKWAYISAFNCFYAENPPRPLPKNGFNALCSQYKFVGSYPNLVDKSCAYIYNNTIAVRDSAYGTDATAFKTAMSGVQLAYELATPTQTSITPTPIATLKGYNVMWSNGGDITATVRGTPVEVSTLQALNMLLGGAYRNDQTADDVSDDEALDIILGGEQR